MKELQPEIQPKIRKRSKTIFTATVTAAKYVGSHPHLIGTTGVYYWNKSQESYIYRPNTNTKADWFRVFKSSLVAI